MRRRKTTVIGNSSELRIADARRALNSSHVSLSHNGTGGKLLSFISPIKIMDVNESSSIRWGKNHRCRKLQQTTRSRRVKHSPVLIHFQNTMVLMASKLFSFISPTKIDVDNSSIRYYYAEEKLFSSKNLMSCVQRPFVWYWAVYKTVRC